MKKLIPLSHLLKLQLFSEVLCRTTSWVGAVIMEDLVQYLDLKVQFVRLISD